MQVNAHARLYVCVCGYMCMSVINLPAATPVCLSPWVSLFICTTALIMPVADRNKERIFLRSA